MQSTFKYRKRSRPNSLVVSAPPRKRSKLVYKKKQVQNDVEYKYIDTAHTGTVTQLIGTSLADPAFNCLFSIAQGDTPSSRDGRKVTILSTHIRLMLRGSDTNDTIVRVVVFKDKQSNGQIPLPGEVLKTNTASVSDVLAFRNLDYSSRYIVQHDETVNLERRTGSGAVTESTKTLHLNKTVNCPVLYHAPNRDLSSIVDNSWHIMLIANKPNVVFGMQVRARFIG